MALKSFLLSGNTALEACARQDSAHILRGARGVHVGKIQAALVSLDGVIIEKSEWESMVYGPTTEAAVLAYKQQRKIINRSYQNQADAIVGRMTIASLDEEMKASETAGPSSGGGRRCSHPDCSVGERSVAQKRKVAAFRQAQPKAVIGNPVASGGSAFSVKAPVRAPIAPTAGPGKPKLELTMNPSEGGGSTMGGLSYQMVPQAGTGSGRTVLLHTFNNACRLMIPDKLDVELDGTALKPKAGIADIAPRAAPYLLTVKGKSALGNAVMMVRLPEETWEEVLARDVLFCVKPSIKLKAGVVFLTDARKNRTVFDAADLQAAMTSVTGFLKRWINVDLTYKGSIEKQVDEDLGNPFDHNLRVAAEDGGLMGVAGMKQRCFDNEFDKGKDDKNKVVYVMWRLSDPMIVGVTSKKTRVFLQDYFNEGTTSKNTKLLTLCLAHELCHSLGVTEHSDQVGNLMFKTVDGVGARLDFVDIDTCNPT